MYAAAAEQGESGACRAPRPPTAASRRPTRVTTTSSTPRSSRTTTRPQVTDPTATGGPLDGTPEDPAVGPDADDAINTESVNDAGGGGPGALRGHPRRGERPRADVRRRHPRPTRRRTTADARMPVCRTPTRPSPPSGSATCSGCRPSTSTTSGGSTATGRSCRSAPCATCSSRCCRCSTTSRRPASTATSSRGRSRRSPTSSSRSWPSTAWRASAPRARPFDPMQHEALMHAPWPRRRRAADRRDGHDGRHGAAARLPCR